MSKRAKISLLISIILVSILSGGNMTFLLIILNQTNYNDYTVAIQLLNKVADSPPILPLLAILAHVSLICTLFFLRKQSRSTVILLTTIVTPRFIGLMKQMRDDSCPVSHLQLCPSGSLQGHIVILKYIYLRKRVGNAHVRVTGSRLCCLFPRG